jgi:AAA domain/Relaxase/Mobilisation nuclease domain
MIVFKGGRRSVSGARTGLLKSFVGLITYLTEGPRYALNPDRVAWISWRNLDGVNQPASFAQVMRAHASENPRVENPVYHFGLTLHAGEHLSYELWNQAVDRVLEGLGLDPHQALIVAHRDTANEHVHVVVNRVRDGGRTWRPRYDGLKAFATVQDLEIDLGLIRTVPRNLPAREVSSGTYQQALRTGQQPLADRVRDRAAAAFADATGWGDLEARLAARGFRLEPAARSSGLLITDGSRFASLSRVDRSLSGPKLARRFGETFDEHRQAHPEPPTVLAPGHASHRPPRGSLEHRAAELLDRLTETRATFTAADLRRAVFYQPDSVALVGETLRSDRVLDLGRDVSGATRYTTRDYLDAEARLLAAAASLSSRDHFRLDPVAPAGPPTDDHDRAAPGSTPAIGDDPAAVNQAHAARDGPAAAGDALAAGYDRAAPIPAAAAGEPSFNELSGEQRTAVLHATTTSDLAQVVGGDGPGQGRIAVARAIAAAYQEQDYEVRGAALTAKAAATLQSETSVPSRTLASLERAWSEGADRLHARSVLILDQAGSLDVQRLGCILADAAERGAKVVLLGDPDRLQAIGAGDAFRGLLDQYPSVRLDSVDRQPQVASTLDRCEAAGCLHWTDSRDAARAELLAAWARDRCQDPAGSQLIVAQGHTEVAQLNDAVRAERRAAGEIGPGVRAGSVELASGDRIVFQRDDRQGRAVVNLETAPDRGVRAGALGTVVAAEPRRVEIRLDDGRAVAFDPARHTSVAHGYAVTVHRLAGAPVDRVYVLAGSRMDRHGASVALNTHRDRVAVFADRETFPSREHLDKALSRTGHKDLASDYAAAELRRGTARLQDLATKIHSATLEERPLGKALAALSDLNRARQRVIEARRSVVQAADRVYADPAKALHSLLRDPEAPARLRQGEARLYGHLQGRALLGASNRERTQAIHGVPTLTGRLDAYQRAVGGLHAAKRTFRAQAQQLTSPGLHSQPQARTADHTLPGADQARALSSRIPSPAQIKSEMARVTDTLQTLNQASRGAQDAIETAIRGMGSAAVDNALLLLPPEVAMPVNLAERAVAHAIERTLDLGQGLDLGLGLGR